MKHAIIMLICIGLFSGACAALERADLKDQKAKDSYSLGYQFGGNLKKQAVEFDLEVYLAGLRDALENKKGLMSAEEISENLKNFQAKLAAASQKKYQEEAGKTLKDGIAFLDQNAKKAGVKTLPSGLQYKVVTKGSGDSPKKDDTVTVNYRGTLVDGTVFDSSYDRSQPIKFRVDGVIQGWTEALQLMKVGSKWQLFIPSGLAYGPRGQSPRIPPNATLIFDVELISIQK